MTVNNWRRFSQTAIRVLSERATVHVTHVRKFNFRFGNTVETSYMSRSRFEKNMFSIEMADAIDQFGGYTEVKIEFPDGRVVKGKHNFNNKRFCRSFGTMVSIRKALSSCEENGLLCEIETQLKAA